MYAGACAQLLAQRESGLHPVPAGHLKAHKCGEIAALTQLAHQLPQDRVAHTLLRVVGQRCFRQVQQARRERAVAPIRLAHQPAAVFQLGLHAAPRGLGPAR